MCAQEVQLTSDLVRRDPDCEAMSQNSCKRTQRVVIREQVLGYLISNTEKDRSEHPEAVSE
jgi:hypothetical protein